MTNEKVKLDEKYWYGAEDVINLFKDYTKDIDKLDVKFPIDTKDEISIGLTINKAITEIKEGKFDIIAIPVNINNRLLTIDRSHWTALVIKKNEKGEIVAHYNDSFGNAMHKKIPKLYQALKNNDIDEKNIIDYKVHQQSNSYDCGPWTVFNLRDIVQGHKPYNLKDNLNLKPNIKEQRLKLFRELNQEFALEENLAPAASITNNLDEKSLSRLNMIKNKLKDIAKRISLPKISMISTKAKVNDKTPNR